MHASSGGPTESIARSDRRYERAAVLLWLASWVVVSVLVAIDPARRSVTPVYHEVVQRWQSGVTLYPDGWVFHYLPQFALLFTPFHVLPSPIGDILWRLAAVVVCLHGIRIVLRQLLPAASGRVFFFASLLALAPCLGAIRNGQTNLAFAGLTLLAAACLAQTRWWPTAFTLAVLVTVKPLGFILLALAAVVYPRLRWPLLLALALLGVLPFLFARADYVLAQYRQAASHLAGLTATTQHRVADAAGLLRAVGVELPVSASQTIRALAGAMTLALSLLAASTSAGPRRAMTVVLLAATYLMLFSPMTEKNTYAILALPLSVAAMCCLSTAGFSRLGWTFVFVLVSIGVFPELFSRIDRDFGLWWDPLMMVVVYGFVALRILRREGVFPDEPAAPLGSSA